MMLAKYVNSAGKAIRFDDGTFILRMDQFRNYKWNYTLRNHASGRGGTVRSFTVPPRTLDFTLGARGTELDFYWRLNQLHDITEYDIAANAPGRLWLGKQYITCYLAVGSALTMHSRNAHFLEKTVTMLMLEPFWTTEHKHSFLPEEAKRIAQVKKYPNRYPYRYGAAYALHFITNAHYAPAPFVLTVYGPCINPVINVGSNQTGANITLLADEKLVIDQLKWEVYKVSARGDIVNMFDRRTKAKDPFAPAPVGLSQVQFNGDFAFDLVLHYQRSEPTWT